MENLKLRKYFQWVKQLSFERFKDEMNYAHSRAYYLGQKHLIEAMEMHPRISKPMVNQVIAKAEEIRELWDGLEEVTFNEPKRIGE
jgi:hypothetical protein